MSERMGGGVSVLGLSRLPVGWLVWQRPPRGQVLTVVCRATFFLRPGEALLASEQEPLAAAEQFYADGASLGIYAPADLVPMKPRADVLLVGHAFAPGGRPVRSLFARLTVGEVDKRIEVFCDRHFDLQGALREGPRFASMPLVYERAAGGPETTNPIGVRPDARNAYGRITLPNLQPPGLEIASASDFIAPIGFGPIASVWPSRRALLGSTEGAEPPAPGQYQLVPTELDPAHFHAAPSDQQMQALHDDERLTLENLHPQHARLITRLPGIHPRTFVEGLGAPQSVAMRADTLWIDSSRGICTMTWRGQIRLEHASQSVRVLVAMEEPGRPLAWEDVARLRDAAITEGHGAMGAPLNVDQTRAAPLDVAAMRPAALPFVATHDPQAPRDLTGDGGLPFRSPGAPPAPLMPAPPPLSDAESTTLAIPLVRVEPAAATPSPGGSPRFESRWAHDASASGSAPSSSEPVTAPTPPIVALPLSTVSLVPAASLPLTAPAKSTAWSLPVSPPPRTSTPDALNLVWFDPQCLSHLRRDPRFAPILEALDEQSLDQDLDDPANAETTADIEDRREAFEILARGAISAAGVTAALDGAARGDGRLLQPIVLVAGELAFSFDELEALKAMISVAAPHTHADSEAKAILDLAKEFLGTPGLPGAPAVAEGLGTRIRETFEKRSLVSPAELDAQAERALLGGRKFQRRAIFGGPHVRALFHAGLEEGPIPAYLCEELAAKLPAAHRLRVRLLAHVHPAVDQHETHPAALRAVALGIVTTPMVRR